MILTKTQLGADDKLDMVVIRLGDLLPMVPYQIALEVAQSLRVGCKQAARFDRAPARFWKEMVSSEDPRKDTPKAHRGFRRSKMVANVSSWEVKCNPPLVGLFFDGTGKEMNYEDGIHLHLLIRKAGLRAKAWSGDTGFNSRTIGMLTSAEEDYRLGVG